MSLANAALSWIMGLVFAASVVLFLAVHHRRRQRRVQYFSNPGNRSAVLNREFLLAASRLDATGVTELANLGADPQATTQTYGDGMYHLALHAMALIGEPRIEILQALRDAGCNPDQRDGCGRTASALAECLFLEGLPEDLITPPRHCDPAFMTPQPHTAVSYSTQDHKTVKMAGISVPIKIMHEGEGHVVTIELKNGEIYRGKLVEAEDNMNSQLRDVTFTARDGQVAHVESVYIRGSKIRFFVLPDMLKNAPMFKRASAKGMTAGRGKTAILRAQALGKLWAAHAQSSCSFLVVDAYLVRSARFAAAAKAASRGRGAGRGHQYR
ncbi:uncharacterized protein MONBRDRAFT_32618 [Monosiga brevicollis MX1]|uniref:Sm domain-containing protein n=1 Tax=Monosiga brevicollis TaxID=81824 RepID=A9V0R2_MONBE|nr:uncharacterized protein MONBRDRAFT_32618 [Monosiga brevicollis MX1]EDQ88798.1 predicted protein [Monosiga brevicollis MX1]|eukprot:XP_001746411.1 hypothetical protein [Monosiga brevicollis MX1]